MKCSGCAPRRRGSSSPGTTGVWPISMGTVTPAWLKAIMDGWADGLNFYLATHPSVRPKVILHFEPWMALSFTEGSIGGDIETMDVEQLQKLYCTPPPGRSAPRGRR